MLFSMVSNVRVDELKVFEKHSEIRGDASNFIRCVVGLLWSSPDHVLKERDAHHFFASWFVDGRKF